MTTETRPSLRLHRDARLFIRRPALLEDLAETREAVHLAPSQLAAPDAPADWVLRLGRLRLTEFLPDDREVCRAVLQAGSCFVTRHAPDDGPGPWQPLDRTTLMALGDAELWRLPAGTLTEDDE